jgi:hypothetical protein
VFDEVAGHAFPSTGAKEIESIHCDRNHCTLARDGSEMRYHSHSEIRYGRISKLQQGLNDSVHSHDTVVIGGGPAGLMAAQQLAAAGRRCMCSTPCLGGAQIPSGRKGGLNLTHSEPADVFLSAMVRALWWCPGWRASVRTRCAPSLGD